MDNITLLVHTRMATLKWGKAVIEAFHRHAVRNNITLNIVYSWENAVDSSVIVLVGVDELWLKEVLEHLDTSHQHIILTNGVVEQYRHNISHVLSDQDVLIKECIKLLETRGRTKTALFGVQKNDTSDESKAIAFTRYLSSRDIYYVDNDIDACFDEFIVRLEHYDSVVCANDIMAIYLLGRFRELDISVPERLFLIGNGNLWLSEHVTPSLTTVSYDSDTMAAVTLQICKNLLSFEKLGSVDIHLKGELIKRESTGDASEKQKSESIRSLYQYDDNCDICEKIYQINAIDRVLSFCTQEKRDILRLLTENASYSEIAKIMYLSEDAVKYHIKKLYKALNIHSKEELCKLIHQFGIRL